MGITFNGYPVETIRYNGVTIEDLIVNNTAISMFNFDTSIFDKTEFSQADVMYIMEYAEKGGIQLSNYTDKLVGKLITGLSNSLYSGKYRIIGVNHDGSYNTIDVLTEDCVQQASSGFGGTDRHYNSSDCYARIFAEETFYNAFDNSIKDYIKPMKVEYRYSTSTVYGSTGTLQYSIVYGKLLSFTEVGTTYASSTSQGDKFQYADGGSEGNKYPYFDAAGSALSNLRIKKYNGTAVSWWLRSRATGNTVFVGGIYTSGNADYNGYINTGYYLAPVIRLKVKSKYDYLFDKSSFTYNDILDILNSGADFTKHSDRLVGKLVSGLTNSLYSGDYRIIGVNHDGTTNTLDLITEGCVTSMVFGTSNRHYNDPNCTVRNYVEDTFYNAFNSDVKSYIKPMEVKYYYNNTAGITGSTLQTTTAYCKLLSYNEIGYGASGPSEYYYSPGEADEGNVYPYYNNTDISLRIKRYNGNAVFWWLRSRSTNGSYGGSVGIIATGGNAYDKSCNNTYSVAPVLRIG